MNQESDEARIAKVEHWFAERNFLLAFEEGAGLTWAYLIRRETGQKLGRYSRGVDRPAAAERALQRWEQEQGA